MVIRLIRDNIPALIEKEGKVCNYATAQTDGIFMDLLRAKLYEDAQIFLSSSRVEDLASIVDVIYTLLSVSGISDEDFKKVQDAVVANDGAFTKRYVGFFQDQQPTQEQQPQQEPAVAEEAK